MSCIVSYFASRLLALLAEKNLFEFTHFHVEWDVNRMGLTI